MGNGEALFQKFTASKQEPVRLQLALQGYFLTDGITKEQRATFEDYLRRRIRPAAETLIQTDELPKLQVLDAQGWLDASVIEDCMDSAICLKKTEAFIWLLGIKAEKYGFPDKNFDL